MSAGSLLGGVIAMITLEVAVILILIFLRQRYNPICRREQRPFSELSGRSLVGTLVGDRVLLLFRFCSFLYFLCVAWAWNWSKAADGNSPSQKYNYFTNWNLVLITVYFLNALSCSVLHALDKVRHLSAQHHAIVEQLCRNSARLFDVCGSCALFVTVVSYGILDHSGDQWNVIAHITNSVFMIVEAAFNDLAGSMESFKFVIFWAYFYLIFTWGLVGTGVKGSPYFFLETSSATAFGWYSGLLVLLFLFFIIWIYALELKYYLARRYGLGNSYRSQEEAQKSPEGGGEVELVESTVDNVSNVL